MGSLADLALAARDMVAHGWFGAMTDAGNYARRNGNAPRHCVVTAIGELELIHRRGYPLRELCLEVLGMPAHLGAIALVDWNNHPDRTQEEVIDLFDDVARLAKDREL